MKLSQKGMPEKTLQDRLFCRANGFCSRKSQISVFLLLGLVMMSAVGVIVYTSSSLIESKATEQMTVSLSAATSAGAFQKVIEECMQDAIDNAVYLASAQGGRIYKQQVPGYDKSLSNPDKIIFNTYFYDSVKENSISAGIDKEVDIMVNAKASGGADNVNAIFIPIIMGPPVFMRDCSKPGPQPPPYYPRTDCYISSISYRKQYPLSTTPQLVPLCNYKTGPNRKGLAGAACGTHLHAYGSNRTIQDQLAAYVGQYMQRSCFGQDDLKKIFPNIEMQSYRPNVEVAIGDKDLTLNLSYPFDMKVKSIIPVSKELSFVKKYPSRLKQAHAWASDFLMQEQVRLNYEIDAQPYILSSYPQGMSVQLTPRTSNFTNMVEIIDEEYYTKGKPAKFSFAIKNRYPVLSLIRDSEESPYDIVVYAGDTIDIPLIAEDPDEKDRGTLTFEFAGWNEDYRGFFEKGKIETMIVDGVQTKIKCNFDNVVEWQTQYRAHLEALRSTDSEVSKSSIRAEMQKQLLTNTDYLKKCMSTELTRPRNWSKRYAKGVPAVSYTTAPATFDFRGKIVGFGDTGLHYLTVRVRDDEGLYDYQNVSILVLPKIEGLIEIGHEYGDIESGFMSLEDVLEINTLGSSHDLFNVSVNYSGAVKTIDPNMPQPLSIPKTRKGITEIVAYNPLALKFPGIKDALVLGKQQIKIIITPRGTGAEVAAAARQNYALDSSVTMLCPTYSIKCERINDGQKDTLSWITPSLSTASQAASAGYTLTSISGPRVYAKIENKVGYYAIMGFSSPVNVIEIKTFSLYSQSPPGRVGPTKIDVYCFSEQYSTIDQLRPSTDGSVTSHDYTPKYWTDPKWRWYKLGTINQKLDDPSGTGFDVNQFSSRGNAKKCAEKAYALKFVIQEFQSRAGFLEIEVYQEMSSSSASGAAKSQEIPVTLMQCLPHASSAIGGNAIASYPYNTVNLNPASKAAQFAKDEVGGPYVYSSKDYAGDHACCYGALEDGMTEDNSKWGTIKENDQCFHYKEYTCLANQYEAGREPVYPSDEHYFAPVQTVTKSRAGATLVKIPSIYPRTSVASSFDPKQTPKVAAGKPALWPASEAMAGTYDSGIILSIPILSDANYNDVYSREYGVKCKGDRGNICNGTKTDTWKILTECSDLQYCKYGEAACKDWGYKIDDPSYNKLCSKALSCVTEIGPDSNPADEGRYLVRFVADGGMTMSPQGNAVPGTFDSECEGSAVEPIGFDGKINGPAYTYNDITALKGILKTDQKLFVGVDCNYFDGMSYINGTDIYTGTSGKFPSIIETTMHMYKNAAGKTILEKGTLTSSEGKADTMKQIYAADYSCGIGSGSLKSCIAEKIDPDTNCAAPNNCNGMKESAPSAGYSSEGFWCDSVFGTSCLGKSCWSLGSGNAFNKVVNEGEDIFGNSRERCCGDDDNETPRICRGSDVCIDKVSCCSGKTDCVAENGDCVASGTSIDIGGKKLTCNLGSWGDVDLAGEAACTAVGTYVAEAIGVVGEGGNGPCCGDDYPEIWAYGGGDAGMTNRKICCGRDIIDDNKYCLAAGKWFVNGEKCNVGYVLLPLDASEYNAKFKLGSTIPITESVDGLVCGGCNDANLGMPCRTNNDDSLVEGVCVNHGTEYICDIGNTIGSMLQYGTGKNTYRRPIIQMTSSCIGKNYACIVDAYDYKDTVILADGVCSGAGENNVCAVCTVEDVSSCKDSLDADCDGIIGCADEDCRQFSEACP